MARGAVTGRGFAAGSPEDLLALAMSRPVEAERRARELLADSRDPRVKTYAYHAVGIVRRDANDLAQSLRVLRQGLRLAERHGLPDRAADIGATLGTALAMSGRVPDAVSAFDAALARSRGVAAARVRMRRGAALHWATGDSAPALADYRAALPAFRRHGDLAWEARTLHNRATVYTELRELGRADVDLQRSEAIYLELDQPYGAAMARHNRADLALLRGDLPAALTHVDVADRRYREAGVTSTDLLTDRGEILLAAGLAGDAVHWLDEALAQIPAGSTVRRATALGMAAEAARRSGALPASMAYARRSLALQRRSGNERDACRARLALLRAKYATGAATAAMLGTAEELASAGLLPRHERVEAALVAAHTAARRGDPGRAVRHLDAAARRRATGSPLSRSRGWLAAALRAELRGRPGTVLAACDAGLAVLDEHRLTLGATEMRAASTAHGAELAALGLRHALATEDPATLLAWSERWRATALAVPPVRPPDDRELAADLAALRDVVRRIGDAAAAGTSTRALDGERTRLEESARARTLRVSGDGSGSAARHDPDSVVAALGGTTLVELVAVDGRLHVVVVHGDGRMRRHGAGIAAEAARAVEHARFALHRLSRPARGRAGAALARTAAVTLDASVDELEQLLLGTAVPELCDGPVVVVPPGDLQAVPWGLLPSLRERAVVVAPSAAAWLRSATMRAPTDGGVALVQGPDLGSGGAEVTALVARWAGAVHLQGAAATADNVLAALDGARLAHVAAHGEFRADNPMFSCLGMADGPLTVHDLCRLRRAPYRVVLSACESGLASPVGADELLGLASALVPLGTAGLLASVVPVNDEATVPLMLTVHERLHAGGSLAEGMRDARAAAGDEPLARATAAAFVALGAA